MRRVSLSCAADDLFAMPATVTLRSSLKTLQEGWAADITVLDGGISKANRRRIVESVREFDCSISFVEVADVRISKLWRRAKSCYPKSAYFRILLPELIGDIHSKTIYLDSDLVVLKSLSELWKIDLAENYLLAASDMYVGSVEERLSGYLDFDEFGAALRCKYLQSGVLVLDLKKWRNDCMGDQLIDLITKHPSFNFPDQDALNVLLANKWKEIDPRWNQTPIIFKFSDWKESPYGESTFYQVKYDPFIIHYATGPKPWDPNCAHPLKHVWFEQLEGTHWSAWKGTRWQQATRLIRRGSRRLRKEWTSFGLKN